MKIRAQIGMVLNLDKCIGCHTCSVTCKNVWTNRPGTEYIWFNNVESKPGVGYPKSWEDQQKWTGGWELHNGKLRLRRGSKLGLLSGIFANSKLPQIDDYYEPFTFDYQNLQKSPAHENLCDSSADLLPDRQEDEKNQQLRCMGRQSRRCGY